MLIKSGKSKKTVREDNLNRHTSTEGIARMSEAQQLQAQVQGGLSDIVREHGYVPDEMAHNWLDGLKDQQPHQTNLPRHGRQTFRYDKAQGRVVRVN